MALEDDYRAYREMIAAGIRVLRPHAKVATSRLDSLEEEATRLHPHVVICSLPAAIGPDDRVAWVQLSLDPRRPTLVCIDGRSFERSNPALEAILGVVDEAEQILRERS